MSWADRKNARFWRRQLLASKAVRRKEPPIAPRPGSLDSELESGDPACTACAFHLRTRGVPCLRHTGPGQRQARARAIGAIR